MCSNSYITFGGNTNAQYNIGFVPFPKLLIDADDNYANNITVVVAASNVTVYYRGRRYNPKYGGQLEWKATFFAEAYEKFSVDVLTNSLANAGSGLTSICTASNCYQSFSAAPGLTAFYDCEGGCVN